MCQWSRESKDPRVDERVENDGRRLLNRVPLSRHIRIQAFDDGLCNSGQAGVENEGATFGHKGDELHRRVSLSRRGRIEDVKCEGGHKERGVGRGNVEGRVPGLRCERRELAEGGLLRGQAEERAEDLHGVDIVLPDLEAD